MPDSIPSSPPVISQPLPECVEHDFIGVVYALHAAGDILRATEQIVDHPDDLLNTGQFAQCNEVLRQVDVEKLSGPVIVAFLGITRVASGQLPARAEFCNKARTKLTAEIGRERAVRLLQAYA